MSNILLIATIWRARDGGRTAARFRRCLGARLQEGAGKGRRMDGNMFRYRHHVALGLGLAVLPLPAPAYGSAQGLPFHTETGVTTGFEENAARSYISFLGRSGLVRDGDVVTDPMAREIDVVAVPVGVIPVSFSPFWSTRVVTPYMDKAMDFTGRSVGGSLRPRMS